MHPRILLALFLLPSLAHAQGSDWPKFLGPSGTSVSTEKGILSPWPKAGPKILWHKEVGLGYGMPVIAKGRLFHFDRHEKNLRLTCMNATTGEAIWDFEYPSVYKDSFGYNNGPRCSPLVDGDFVYTYGVEG